MSDRSLKENIMTNDINIIEDALIEAIKNTGAFRAVISVGREALPTTLAYPTAFVYFDGETRRQTRPRPVEDTAFKIFITVKNISQAKANKDAYSLMNAVTAAIEGKTLDVPDIEEFERTDRKITEYEDNEITYEMTIKTVRYCAVPAGD